MEEIKIIQWNCRGLWGKAPELPHICNNQDFILLSETMLSKEKHINIPDMELYRKDRKDGMGGGVAIGIEKGITYHKIKMDQEIFNGEEFEIIGIKVKIKKETEIAIFSVYRPPRFYTKEDQWNKLLQAIQETAGEREILIGGDLNAQSIEWSNHSNPSGRQLIKTLLNKDLCIINTNTPTYMINSTGFSSPDLTLVSKNLATQSKWMSTEETGGSDHFTIQITLFDKAIDNETEIRPRLVTRKINWELFQERIIKKQDQNTQKSNYCHLQEYDNLINNIKESLKEAGATINKNKSIPHNRVNNRKNKWWNEECKEETEKRKKAFLEYKSNQCHETYQKYMTTMTTTKNKLKKIKRDHFRNYAENLDPQRKIGEVWKVIHSLEGKNNSGNKGNDEKEMELIMNAIDKLAPPSAMEKIDIPISPNQKPAQGIWIPINSGEINTIIKNAKTNSAAGPDLITYTVIKKLPEQIIKIITHIFNRIMETGRTPKEWNNYDICLIPKPNNNGYRPISLASCMMKIFEGAFKTRLEYFLETDLEIPPNQYGFRKNRSCADNIALLTTDIYNAFAERKETAVMLLDIEGAYDNVQPKILINMLMEMRLPIRIIKIITNLISQRTGNFYANGKYLGTRTIIKGLPQGTRISPPLYNTYTRKCINHVGPSCSYLQFADDSELHVKGSNLEECKNKLRKGTELLIDYLESIGLTVSKRKSKFMVFSRKRNTPNNINITIKEETLERSHTAMLLGVTLDSKLNWKALTSQLCSNAFKGINILKALSGKSWGSHPTTMLKIYKGLIRARLEWAHPCTLSSNKTNLKK